MTIRDPIHVAASQVHRRLGLPGVSVRAPSPDLPRWIVRRADRDRRAVLDSQLRSGIPTIQLHAGQGAASTWTQFIVAELKYVAGNGKRAKRVHRLFERGWRAGTSALIQAGSQ